MQTNREIGLRENEFILAKELYCNYLAGVKDQDLEMIIVGAKSYSPRTLAQAVKDGEEFTLELVEGFYGELERDVVHYLENNSGDQEVLAELYPGDSPSNMLNEIKSSTVLGRKCVFELHAKIRT